MRAHGLWLMLALVACRDAEARHTPRVSAELPASAEPRASAAAEPSAAPVATAAPEAPEALEVPASIEELAVPGDVRALVVRGRPGAEMHTVFMPGLCSNAYGYLYSFPETARLHGGVVALDGDAPCGAADSGFRSFSWNPALQKKRVLAALEAAHVPVPDDGLTLAGYSSGASIAELMHAEWPDLFPRLVLIAPPVDPEPYRLRTARGVVSMACSLDVTSRMKLAVRRLAALSVPAIYLEMPGCTHGNVAEGERVFDQAFGWLERDRPR
ncbi:MAG: hypothetical protein IT373_34615 [Polyangiaceae bacterium]|nr:hypothetical protein [Polyangiaceae bacterium]